MSKRDVLLIVMPIVIGGALLTWALIHYIDLNWLN